MDNEDADPFASLDLLPISLADKSVFDQFFATCATRLSDYSFANTFIWRDSIHLRWKIAADCLCVFANGDGGLTMLFPPLGAGDVGAALRRCLDICETYNAAARLDHWTRIEYVSQEMMRKFPGDFISTPMSGDYVYAMERMIDLAGGDLASKRQARNRFARRYQVRVEAFEPRHVPECMALLATWRQQVEQAARSQLAVDFKRAKEIAATADAMTHAAEIGLEGLVLRADDQLAGFTLGERLDGDSCSILIEKTDRRFAGSAQYIFSEFCRRNWSGLKWCNVGDDWEIPTLAWTKQSYRPAYRIPKWVLRPSYAAAAARATLAPQPDIAPSKLQIADCKL
ncbi:MAG: DUF2156 domain-containing protein [Phycisphaerae bacterium]